MLTYNYSGHPASRSPGSYCHFVYTTIFSSWGNARACFSLYANPVNAVTLSYSHILKFQPVHSFITYSVYTVTLQTSYVRLRVANIVCLIGIFKIYICIPDVHSRHQRTLTIVNECNC